MWAGEKKKWDAVGRGVLMNSGLDMPTLRGPWETSAGSLNTNLEFWGEQDVGKLERVILYGN